MRKNQIGTVIPFGPWKADGVLLGGDDQFHVPLDAAVHEVVDLALGEAVVVREVTSDFDAGPEAFEAALEAFRHRDAGDGGDPLVLQEIQGLAFAGEQFLEISAVRGRIR